MSKVYRERTGGYTVRFFAYNGFNYNLCEDATKEEAAKSIRSFLRRARKDGCPVSKTAKARWEIETAEDAVAVSDSEGFLSIYPTARHYRRILGRKCYQS